MTVSADESRERLAARRVEDLLGDLAAGRPSPGSGSAAALAGAAAAALVRTVALLTARKAGDPRPLLRERYGAFGPRAAVIAEEAQGLLTELTDCVSDDAARLARVMELRRRRDAATEPERAALAEQAAAALGAAAEIPLRVLRGAVRVAALAAELERHGYRSAAPDAAVAVHLAAAAVAGAAAITAANLVAPEEDPDGHAALAAEIGQACERVAALRDALGRG